MGERKETNLKQYRLKLAHYRRMEQYQPFTVGIMMEVELV